MFIYSAPIANFLLQIFMRYGRQRWKLKGRIEVNSRQSWDGDEMVFMPLISDLINIKVWPSPRFLRACARAREARNRPNQPPYFHVNNRKGLFSWVISR